MVLIHANPDFPCSICDITSSGEGNGNCPECFGLGYRARISKERVFISKPKRGLPSEVDIIPGGFADSRFRIYFSLTSPITTGDFLCEVTWNPSVTQAFVGEPSSFIHVYTVEQAERQYFEGQPVYCTSYLDSSDNHIDPIKQALTIKCTSQS